MAKRSTLAWCGMWTWRPPTCSEDADAMIEFFMVLRVLKVKMKMRIRKVQKMKTKAKN